VLQYESKSESIWIHKFVSTTFESATFVRATFVRKNFEYDPREYNLWKYELSEYKNIVCPSWVRPLGVRCFWVLLMRVQPSWVWPSRVRPLWVPYDLCEYDRCEYDRCEYDRLEYDLHRQLFFHRYRYRKIFESIDTELKYFNPENWLDPGSGPGSGKNLSRIQGSKRHRIPIRNNEKKLDSIENSLVWAKA